MASIFSKIIAGEIPSYKIYEDDHVYAFLDIHPLTSGHTLVVPKREVADFMDMSDELWAHLMQVTKNHIAPALQKATACTRVGLMIEGFGVPDHVHLHAVPLMSAGELSHTQSHTERPEDMENMARTIRDHLEQRR